MLLKFTPKTFKTTAFGLHYIFYNDLLELFVEALDDVFTYILLKGHCESFPSLVLAQCIKSWCYNILQAPAFLMNRGAVVTKGQLPDFGGKLDGDSRSIILAGEK